MTSRPRIPISAATRFGGVTEMPKVLNTSILKPMYKEFNALNKLETKRFMILDKSMRKTIRKTDSKFVCKNVNNKMGEVDGLLRQLLRDVLVVNAKHLQTKIDRTSIDLHDLVGMVSRVVNLMDPSTPSVNVATEGENEFRSQPETTTDDIQTTKVHVSS
ncbi:hypothetical protein Tco_0290328 [Tanacetum coccineum]